MDDLDRSFEHLNRAEEYRAKAIGYGNTLQGRAFAKKYWRPLAARIGADRAHASNNKTLWRALKGIDNETLALSLLVAGVSVCGSDRLGTDRDGEYRDIALWIGGNLGHRGELGLKVGAWGIKMLLALPVFTLEGDDILVLTADVNDFMDDVFVHAIINHPQLSPFGTPPEPWTQVRKGVLPADHWARIKLIRPHHPTIEDAARDAISTAQMQKVLDAINALQAVAYTINKPVLDFMQRKGGPPTPDASASRRDQDKALAKVQAWEPDMMIANAMACFERFYVPLNIDFRGRLYGVPHFNFMREDHVRGLFLFADGKPIGDEGLGWLRMHVAACADGNTWSNEKKPSKLHPHDKQSWTRDNLQTLRTIGETVLGGDDPAALPDLPEENPCQFLAACVELVQAQDAGPGFITRLPLTFDASCSGLQHLCAMTRADEGYLANLVASRNAEDFYTLVASKTYKKANPEIQNLMDGPQDRAIVKRPVMSYFYGSVPGGFARPKWGGHSRPVGMTKQVIDVLKERKRSTEGAQKLARAIYGVVKKEAPKATAVRDFLEKLVKLCAVNNEPLRWTTPLGLPVINCYHEPEIKTFSISLNGRRRVNLVVGDKDGIDVDTAVKSVTANFTHSVDACHLQLVALSAANEGIPMVSVHDCFGTIAPFAGRLNEIIRQEFIRLHERDLLNEVRESAKGDLPPDVELPSLPEKGNLNLEGLYGVLFSVHAFK